MNEAEIARQELIWILSCPRCAWWTHIADIGYEQVKQGDEVFHSCPRCKTRVKKIVGVDIGTEVAKQWVL